MALKDSKNKKIQNKTVEEKAAKTHCSFEAGRGVMGEQENKGKKERGEGDPPSEDESVGRNCASKESELLPAASQTTTGTAGG